MPKTPLLHSLTLLQVVEVEMNKLIRRPAEKSEQWRWEMFKFPSPFRAVIATDYQDMERGLVTRDTFAKYLNNICAFLRKQVNVDALEMPDMKTGYQESLESYTIAQVNKIKCSPTPPEYAVSSFNIEPLIG
jgi:hypothetical protein